MTLKDQMAADTAIFFNVNEMADPATYNGQPITVIANIGRSNDPDSEGSADKATFEVMVSEVNNPKSGDVLEHKDKPWYFDYVESTDGIIMVLAFSANESAYHGR